jgi:predicted Zn-dependent protease
VYKDMGALHKAEEQWKIIVAQVPGYREGWSWRVENLLMQGKLREAQEVPMRLLSQVPALAGTAVTLAARVVEAVGDLANARRILEAGVRECPNDAAPLNALCKLLFFHAHPLEAEAAMAELARRQPEDAGAQHNLGTVLLRLGRNHEAVEAFQASVRTRPDAALTHLSLGYALHNAGRDQEARRAFENCLRLAPVGPAAAEAARQLHALAA